MIKPILLSIVVADHYYRDIQTGKGILAGIFNTISAREFPMRNIRMAVYLAFTDVARAGKIGLKFSNPEGDFSVTLPDWEIAAPNERHAVVEIGGNLGGMSLPRPGMYELSITWDGEELQARRIAVRKTPPKKES
ncbi:MAG: DUF6941 family protein [Fibrobacterota bacterium]